MLDPDSQTLAEEFNSCVASTGSDQQTLDIDKVKQGTSEFMSDLTGFLEHFSVPAISGNPGIFAGLSIAAVALAGAWGEHGPCCGVVAALRFPSVLGTLKATQQSPSPVTSIPTAVYLMYRATSAMVVSPLKPCSRCPMRRRVLASS